MSKLDSDRAAELRRLAEGKRNVHVYHGDCNVILLNEVLPAVKYEEYKRALCILDPYGLDLSWKVIALAACLRTVDVFLNFPVADMNRNVFWSDPSGVDESDVARMNRYWGDESWRNVGYTQETDLFGEVRNQKNTNDVIAEAFRQRLIQVAGFEYVPAPLPMRNSRGAIVYYLFFASHQGVAHDIIIDIFNKFKNWGLAGV